MVEISLSWSGTLLRLIVWAVLLEGHKTSTSYTILEYASIVWGDKNNKVLINELNANPTNKAAKLILDKSPLSSSSAAISNLNWLDLFCKRQMQCCIFMYDLTSDDDRNNTVVRGRIAFRQALYNKFIKSKTWCFLFFIFNFYFLSLLLTI